MKKKKKKENEPTMRAFTGFGQVPFATQSPWKNSQHAAVQLKLIQSEIIRTHCS